MELNQEEDIPKETKRKRSSNESVIFPEGLQVIKGKYY